MESRAWRDGDVVRLEIVRAPHALDGMSGQVPERTRWVLPREVALALGRQLQDASGSGMEGGA